MTRPILKWVYPTCLGMALSVLSVYAQAPHNIQKVENISVNPDLKPDSPIALPTNQRRGGEAAPKGAVSSFSASAHANAAEAHNGLRYPGDLEYQGGPVVADAVQHAVFINPSAACPPNSCFGDPIGFLSDLSRSSFIHITDQYVDDHSSNRYPVGTNFAVSGYPPSSGAGLPFTNLDLAIVAYSLASQTGGFGYNHIYHLFVSPGQDVCRDNTFTNCYSPDNPNSWFFCAYHGSVHDSAGNLALYTVEPYQNVSGCNVGPGTPNGQIADSTNSVLSHETFETITDPRGNAWWNLLANGVFGEEIGDECSFLLFTSTDVFFDPSVVRLNHKLYATQPEYDNSQHACATKPD